MGSEVTWLDVDNKITQWARKKDGLIRSLEEEGVKIKSEQIKQKGKSGKESDSKKINNVEKDPKKQAKEKSCPVCSKKGHWPTNYSGKKILCPDYNDKDPAMKTKMDKEIAARVIAAAGGNNNLK